ncbi:Parvovirus coat protein VP1-like protein [Ureibacillus sp. Re31]|uniref:Parvovirus coat protein VP1-like protein n=2 Tax=Ureibacillus galli TaxID=2762222 RepID=A0ABR8XAX4_9BACL|nr:Parvovirus coat protein VP1-like protein [Ureibacillus galli]
MTRKNRKEVPIMRRPRIGLCYPGYRYCGPGCSGPGAPTNPVDACCKFHDECYLKNSNKRYCDRLFQQCLSSYTHSNSKMGRDARFFSRAINLKNFFF